MAFIFLSLRSQVKPGALSTSTTQENTPSPGSPEHIWNVAFSVFIFRVVIKAWKKKHQGKISKFQ